MMLKSAISIVILAFGPFAWAGDRNLTLTSPSFLANHEIPAQHTCSGSNVNPPLIIKNVPIGTQSMALIVRDPDAPSGNFYHWAVYNIKPDVRVIAENSIPGRELVNDFNQFPYGGPCPPIDQTHHYSFDLYALDTNFTMNENGSPEGYLQKIQGHILGKAFLVGIYKRSSNFKHP